MDPAHRPAPPPVHHGPVDRPPPPGPQRRHGPGHSRAATWPGRPRSRAPLAFLRKGPRISSNLTRDPTQL